MVQELHVANLCVKQNSTSASGVGASSSQVVKRFLVILVATMRKVEAGNAHAYASSWQNVVTKEAVVALRRYPQLGVEQGLTGFHEGTVSSVGLMHSMSDSGCRYKALARAVATASCPFFRFTSDLLVGFKLDIVS
eukprot:scaffold7228_cov523-Prasinococcus_capsulatus_cf.AAC.9